MNQALAMYQNNTIFTLAELKESADPQCLNGTCAAPAMLPPSRVTALP